MTKRDSRFLCYPFMRESSSMVDFEIQTDALTSRVGEAISLTERIPMVQADLRKLQPAVYHLNGSVRGRLAIFPEDKEALSQMYDVYVAEVRDVIDTFVLPQGAHAACVLHVCRSEAKKSVRALHRVSLEKEVPEILFDYAHLLANVFFVMAVYVNQVLGAAEIPFVSKSYPVKKRGGIV